MQSMSRERFLRDYELVLRKEFELEGEPAQWAPRVTGPRFWGEEDASVDLKDKAPPLGDEHRSCMAAACTKDEKYMAISLDTRLMVYDIEARTLQADVTGHQYNIEQLHFISWTAQHAASVPSSEYERYDPIRVKYLLFVQCERESLRNGNEASFTVWRVDSMGRLLDDSTPLPIETLLNDAMNAMAANLSANNDIETAEVEQIRNDLSRSLRHVELQMRQKHRTTVTGRLPSFDSEPFTKDGQKCFFVRNPHTTQQGMRPEEELPQVVVWDIPRSQEICRLKGHTDDIMWAGWAADDQAVVTSAWDETFKIWDAETGVCRHDIGPSGGQNWSGSVSPDTQNVVLSGAGGQEIGVYMVATGTKVANLTRDPNSTRQGWIRTMCWDPCPDQVVMENEDMVLLMNPETGESRVILQYEHVDGTDAAVRMMNHFARWSQLFWEEGGRMLIAAGSESTIYVWDRLDNCKWRFQRPQGRPMNRWGQTVFYLARQRAIVSLDGDLMVRYWKL